MLVINTFYLLISIRIGSSNTFSPALAMSNGESNITSVLDDSVSHTEGAIVETEVQ